MLNGDGNENEIKKRLPQCVENLEIPGRIYSQTRSTVPVTNKLMNSLMENDFVS